MLFEPFTCYSSEDAHRSNSLMWKLGKVIEFTKANVVLSFCCKHELLKFDPVSWSSCLWTFPGEVPFCDRSDTSSFPLALPPPWARMTCLTSRAWCMGNGAEEKWPDPQLGPAPYAEPHGPWRNTCYRAAGRDRVMRCGITQKAVSGLPAIILCLIGNDFDAFWSLSACDVLAFLQSFDKK